MISQQQKSFSHQTRNPYYTEEPEPLHPLAVKISILTVLFCLALLIAAYNVDAVGTFPSVDPNMQLYLRFNNDSTKGEDYTNSRTVYDYSFNQRNGTTFGNQTYNQTDGFLQDGAFRFNGTNYIRINHNETLSPYNSSLRYTFSLWVKLADDDSGTGSTARQYIFAKGATNNFEYQLEKTNITAGRSIIFRYNNLSASASNAFTVKSNFVPETWYMVTIVLNGTNLTGYLNGNVVGGITLTAPDGVGTANLNIGTRADTATGTGGGALNGSVDEFILLNRSLSRKEVWELYNQYVGCQNPTLSMSLYGNTTFCAGSFSLNSTDSSAAITIGDNNVSISCAGTRIYGNYTQTNSSSSFRNRGIQNTNGYSDFTVNGCTIDDYYIGIYSRNSISQRLTNLTCTDCSALVDFSNVTLSIYANSTCMNCSTFVGETYAADLMIDNVSCISSVSNRVTPGQSCLSLTSARNVTVKNSYFYRSGGVFFSSANQYNNTITNNSFLTQAISTSNDGRHLILRDNTGNSSGFYVTNNYFDNFDMGVVTANISNVFIRGNTFVNATTNQDYYDLAIHVQFNTTDLWIEDNVIKNFGSTGILLRQTYNATIKDNNFTQQDAALLNGNYDCTAKAGNNICNSDPITAIFIHEVYKGFIPVGTSAWFNYTQAIPQISKNINISGNSFTNVPVILRNQGGINVTNDITNMWFRSFQLPFYTDRDDFYLSNSWDNASAINGNRYDIILYQGIYQNWSINYSLTKTYDQFKDVHTDGRSRELRLYNLTVGRWVYSVTNRSYVYWVPGLNSDQYNYTLASNEQIEASTPTSFTNATFISPTNSFRLFVNNTLTATNVSMNDTTFIINGLSSNVRLDNKHNAVSHVIFTNLTQPYYVYRTNGAGSTAVILGQNKMVEIPVGEYIEIGNFDTSQSGGVGGGGGGVGSPSTNNTIIPIIEPSFIDTIVPSEWSFKGLWNGFLDIFSGVPHGAPNVETPSLWSQVKDGVSSIYTKIKSVFTRQNFSIQPTGSSIEIPASPSITQAEQSQTSAIEDSTTTQETSQSPVETQSQEGSSFWENAKATYLPKNKTFKEALGENYWTIMGSFLALFAVLIVITTGVWRRFR